MGNDLSNESHPEVNEHRSLPSALSDINCNKGMGNRTESQASTALLQATQGLVMNTSGSITTRAENSMQIYPEVANTVVLGHAPLPASVVSNSKSVLYNLDDI